jgi:hypothetical protein
MPDHNDALSSVSDVDHDRARRAEPRHDGARRSRACCDDGASPRRRWAWGTGAAHEYRSVTILAGSGTDVYRLPDDDTNGMAAPPNARPAQTGARVQKRACTAHQAAVPAVSTGGDGMRFLGNLGGVK